ncbi:MAG: autotransporter outer membrane beta-barrel domain-containing protein, partial [Planctomycetes bacterium]|nr:autotransporter outer membrane beta-barrel domain-containing protein [Planctomycetota bacterium]
MSTRMSALKAVAILAVGFTIGAVGIAPAMDTNYANTSHASQMSYDSFNYSVRKRLDAVRSGETVRDYGRYGGYGTYSAAPLYSSDAALGMAPATVVGPATRTATYAPTRRQLDCVYYNGFTVWGDMYQTWSRQRSRNGESGYKYRTTGPAIGFDWSSEVFTIGLATTFNWGNLKGVDLDHTLK